jgi:Glutathione S-transferase, N-terminal domain
MLENGWTFEDGPGVVPDPNLGAKFLYEIYIASDPNYAGRVTVPVLWDKRRGAIVNNESSEIIRMMNCALRPWREIRRLLSGGASTRDRKRQHARLRYSEQWGLQSRFCDESDGL